MAKEVKGWREPRSWDYNGDNVHVKAAMEASQSDDGWVCPHCGVKETLADAEMRTEKVHDLIFEGDAVKNYCYSCGKDYFVKCWTRFSYSSCADEKFEEDA